MYLRSYNYFLIFWFDAHLSDPGGKSSDGRVDSKSRYNWKDITEEFMSSASALQMGELLHDTKWARTLLFLINIYIKQWYIQYLSQVMEKVRVRFDLVDILHTALACLKPCLPLKWWILRWMLGWCVTRFKGKSSPLILH